MKCREALRRYGAEHGDAIFQRVTRDIGVKLGGGTVVAGAVAGSDERARVVARKIRAGQVRVNAGGYFPAAPFGGYKQSGIGREMGVAGLAEFLELKTLAEPAG